MFGFGKKTKPAKKKPKSAKASPARKATGAKKTTTARKAAKPRATRAACVVCRERAQTNTTLRICGRRRCATELAQRSRQAPAPAKAAPRRASAKRRPAKPGRVWRAEPDRMWSGPATPAAAPKAKPAAVATDKPATDSKAMSATELAAWWQAAQASGQRAQIKDWNHHHRQWRNEITGNAAALNQVAARLAGPDRAALNDIATAAAAITDDQISRAAEADTVAKRPSATAARLLALGDRLTALTVKYERAGVIKVNRS